MQSGTVGRSSKPCWRALSAFFGPHPGRMASSHDSWRRAPAETTWPSFMAVPAWNTLAPATLSRLRITPPLAYDPGYPLAASTTVRLGSGLHSRFTCGGARQVLVGATVWEIAAGSLTAGQGCCRQAPLLFIEFCL